MSKSPVPFKVKFHKYSAAPVPDKFGAPPVPGVRIFKSATKRLPTVTKTTWANIEAAARVPHKGRQYPEIVEAPDGSI